MKADQVLIAHHEVLRGLLTRLAATTDAQGRRRRRLRDELVAELGVHVRIEDELFYPAVAQVTPLLAISQAEHRTIDDQLAVVLRTDTAGPEFLTEVTMLAATLEHHAGEEEREMFPQSHGRRSCVIPRSPSCCAARNEKCYATCEPPGRPRRERCRRSHHRRAGVLPP